MRNVMLPAVVPIMLSSKLLPEQQLQHAEQLQDLQRTHGPLGSKAQSGHVQASRQRALCKARLIWITYECSVHVT